MHRSITAVTVRDADTIWHEQGGWFDLRLTTDAAAELMLIDAPLEFEPWPSPR